jgi:hypothetical protein
VLTIARREHLARSAHRKSTNCLSGSSDLPERQLLHPCLSLSSASKIAKEAKLSDLPSFEEP